MGKCSKNNDKSTYKNYVHMSTILLLKYSVNVYDGEREGEIEREKTKEISQDVNSVYF